MKKKKTSFYEKTRCVLCISGCSCESCVGIINSTLKICNKCLKKINVPNHINYKQYEKYLKMYIEKHKKLKGTNNAK